MTDCEICKYFEMHPFIRNNDWSCYCFHEENNCRIEDMDIYDVILCRKFKKDEDKIQEIKEHGRM